MFGFLFVTDGRQDKQTIVPGFRITLHQGTSRPIEQRKLSAEITAQANTGLRAFFHAKH